MLDQSIYDQLMAILPHVPQLLAASKSVWELMIKPILKSKNYPISNELEQEMLNKEKNNDVVGIIECIEKLAKSLSNINSTQINTGENVRQMAFNSNSGTTYIENVNINSSVENKQENLPLMADEILIAAIMGHFPEIKVYENSLGGQYEINANGKEWSSAESIKIIEYSDVIKKLKGMGYIEYIRKNTYKVTKSGADYVKTKINST